MEGMDPEAMAMAYAAQAPPETAMPHHPHVRPIINPNTVPFPPSQPSIPPDPYAHHYPHPHQMQTPMPMHMHMQHSPAAPAGHPNRELLNIQTLFVAGLPDDVKPREIHNLFRRCPGFDNCQLKYTGKGNQVVAFASFFNHQAAVGAMNALNGVIFDPETGATLHVELARSNSRAKRPWGCTAAYAVIDKRHKVSKYSQETESDDGDGGNDDPSGTDNPISSNKDALAATQSGETGGNLDNSHDVLNEQSEKPVAGEIPPCSTLFIANLGPNCTEEELKQALSQYNGFHMIKMRARGGMPVAFADFKEVQHATEAIKSLQDSLLPSSDRGGMHVEYARAKMRKR